EELSRRALRYLERSRAHAEGLSLVEHEALETQILAGALAAAIRSEVGPAYPDFSARVRRLVDGEWIEDDSNPLGATALAASIVTVLAGVAETSNARLALRQCLASRLAKPVAAAISAAASQLAQADVKPLEPPAL